MTLEAFFKAQIKKVNDHEIDQKLTSRLIDFIMHCSVADLAEQKREEGISLSESKRPLVKSLRRRIVGTLFYSIQKYTVL